MREHKLREAAQRFAKAHQKVAVLEAFPYAIRPLREAHRKLDMARACLEYAALQAVEELEGESQPEDTLKDLARAVDLADREYDEALEQHIDGTELSRFHDTLVDAWTALRSYLNGTEDGR